MNENTKEPCSCCEGPMLVTCEDCEGAQWEFNVLAIPALLEKVEAVIESGHARLETRIGELEVALAKVKA